MLDIPRPTDITQITDPQELKLIRAKIAAVAALAKQAGTTRKDDWLLAFNAMKAFVISSIHAGKLWSEIEDKRGPGQSDSALPNWESAGFTSRNDAMVCQRLSWLDSEDIRVYFEDCLDNTRLPSVGGLYRIWQDYFGEPPEEDECVCYVCGNVHKRKTK